MSRKTHFFVAVVVAGALSVEIAGAEIGRPHVETSIPPVQPTATVPFYATGAIVAPPAFYTRMVPVYTNEPLAIEISGTPVTGRFSLDKAMSLLGKFVRHAQLRGIRRNLLAGKPQAVGGQGKSSTATAPTEQASAHEAVMHFLQGIKIVALPEGKQLLADTQWIVGAADYGENFYSRPDYTEAKSAFASLFDTDIPTIKGYKELFDMKALTQAGTTRDIKFLVIAFKDGVTGSWKVLGSRDNFDDDSALDIDQQIAYFRNHQGGRSGAKDYAQLLVLNGQTGEARSELNTAKKIYGELDPPDVTDLQINALLVVIDRITFLPKNSQ